VRRDLELAGQTVVVIGGSSGIGLETARLGRHVGANVIITARNADRIHRAGLELGASIAAFDATDFARLDKFFEALPAPVDHVLVTCPGPYAAPLAEFDLDAARRSVDAQLLLPLQVARNARSRIRPGGTLLLTGCIDEHRSAVGLSLVSALSAALPALTTNLALEVAPVRVNSIATGFDVSPAGIAALAVHTMTNSAITGATFAVDGGQQLVRGGRSPAGGSHGAGATSTTAGSQPEGHREARCVS
jgi:NAD(P)-dependent dehydrogenase (short-subunit alcohol dehydrogenase family)